ncbi:MAG: hypothetical protein MJ183_10535 [Treponemataceae bacterium]|nr:hypothetical protein [Treponemataceae bacterium]
MAKKSAKFSIVYLVGVALVIAGFCCPVFALNAVGGLIKSSSNGFSFVKPGDNGFSTVNIGAILIIAGAVVGAVLCFLKGKNMSTFRLIALLVSIAGGVVLYIAMTQNSFYKWIAEGFLNHASFGFYMIIAGWIVGLVGWILKK